MIYLIVERDLSGDKKVVNLIMSQDENVHTFSDYHEVEGFIGELRQYAQDAFSGAVD